MALTFKFDDAQLGRLVAAINGLSDNLAKWQGEQAEAISAGFSSLIQVLGGTDSEEAQRRLDELAVRFNKSSDKVQESIDQQTKGEK
jgi:hypothetical protein